MHLYGLVGQIKKMKSTPAGDNSGNRLQDIWIWNGRPHWDEVFQDMKEQRQHSDIGKLTQIRTYMLVGIRLEDL